MKLREYLKINQITVKEFSEKIRYGQNYIYRVISGSLKPGSKLCKVIIEYTKGQVTLDDLTGTYQSYEKNLCPCCKQFHIK